MNPISFHEEQRFSGRWRWFFAAFMLVPIGVVLVWLIILAASTGADVTVPLIVLGAVELGELALLVLILRTRVVVRVTDEMVTVKVPIFGTERIVAADLAEVETVPSGLRRRFGSGIGKRGAAKVARYTVGNDAGVVLRRENGWRIVIGSQRTAELAQAIDGLRRTAATR